MKDIYLKTQNVFCEPNTLSRQSRRLQVAIFHRAQDLFVKTLFTSTLPCLSAPIENPRHYYTRKTHRAIWDTNNTKLTADRIILFYCDNIFCLQHHLHFQLPYLSWTILLCITEYLCIIDICIQFYANAKYFCKSK